MAFRCARIQSIDYIVKEVNRQWNKLFMNRQCLKTRAKNWQVLICYIQNMTYNKLLIFALKRTTCFSFLLAYSCQVTCHSISTSMEYIRNLSWHFFPVQCVTFRITDAFVQFKIYFMEQHMEISWKENW